MDVGMSGFSPFEASRQIRELLPGTKVLFVSMYDDEDYLGQAMESGASGYVLKDTPADQFIAAVREVAKGRTYLSPKMVSSLADRVRGSGRKAEQPSRFGSLTPREMQVLKMIAEGRSAKEIAAELNLGIKTVETHKFNLMRKLDIHNTARLVQYAIRKKIIQVTERPFDPAPGEEVQD